MIKSIIEVMFLQDDYVKVIFLSYLFLQFCLFVGPYTPCYNPTIQTILYSIFFLVIYF